MVGESRQWGVLVRVRQWSLGGGEGQGMEVLVLVRGRQWRVLLLVRLRQWDRSLGVGKGWRKGGLGGLGLGKEYIANGGLSAGVG